MPEACRLPQRWLEGRIGDRLVAGVVLTTADHPRNLAEC